MNKAGFPEEPQNSSSMSGEDIPEALRALTDVQAQGHSPSLGLLIGGIGGVLGAIAVFWFFVGAPRNNVNSSDSSSVATPEMQLRDAGNSGNNESVNQLLGHLKYSEAPASELVPITADGRLKMRKAAAASYLNMSRAARRDGVMLVAISGFRSVQEQNQLFFGVGAKRNQTPAQRAAVSAPPGHSEHHTGYAVDIGDGEVPATNLQTNFENTKAFRWLRTNAARFSFEMSFPPGNAQGVSYEPWHWRFVGDRDSLELFYKNRKLGPTRKK